MLLDEAGRASTLAGKAHQKAGAQATDDWRVIDGPRQSKLGILQGLAIVGMGVLQI